MIQFDTTQPVRDVTTPRYTFEASAARPPITMKQVRGDTWETIDIDGTHRVYLRAESVEYESTLAAQYLKSRTVRA